MMTRDEVEYAKFFGNNREVMEYFGNIFKLLLQGVQIASGNGVRARCLS